MKGKYAILKQEFDRLKMEYDTRVPLAVHSASINECRKLFQDLKNEYENENSRLVSKIKNLEDDLSRSNKEEEKLIDERNLLEKNNFEQSFEIENLLKKITDLENQLRGVGVSCHNRGKSKQELKELKRQLGLVEWFSGMHALNELFN